MEEKELISAIFEDIQDRSSWENKQRDWYRMRFDGIPRAQKPWANAADLHYALSDTKIGELKPFYIDQIYSSSDFALFVPKNREVNPAFAMTAQRWFTHFLKEKTRFEEEIVIAIDKHLRAGFSVVKINYNPALNRVVFEAIEPMDIIVPVYCKHIQDVDRVVHVLEVPKAVYKENPNYKQGEEFLKKISGESNSYTNANDIRSYKNIREGLLNYAKSKSVIVLWEVWTKAGDRWHVQTFSPFAEEAVDDKRANPYNHGKLPFVKIDFEKTEAGYYSPRGVCELTAPEESIANKILNQQMDVFDLTSRPMFTAANPITNTTNLRMRPGQVLQQGIAPMVFPPPPFNFQFELSAVAQRANSRLGSPDAGITDTAQPTLNPRTKFEVSQVAGLNMAKIGSRARIFRMALTEIYRQAWALALQYFNEDLEYFFESQPYNAEKGTLDDLYFIIPSGSSDGMSKEQAYAKSIGRMQMFTGNPFVNQSELAKSALESDDPSIVNRLFIEPQQQQNSQRERQQNELIQLMAGYPVALKNDDVDEIHIEVMIEDMVRKWNAGQDPRQYLSLIENHLMEHLERLRLQKNDNIYEGYRRKINEIINADTQIKKQLMQQQGGQNVPMVQAVAQ